MGDLLQFTVRPDAADLAILPRQNNKFILHGAFVQFENNTDSNAAVFCKADYGGVVTVFKIAAPCNSNTNARTNVNFLLNGGCADFSKLLDNRQFTFSLRSLPSRLILTPEFEVSVGLIVDPGGTYIFSPVSFLIESIQE